MKPEDLDLWNRFVHRLMNTVSIPIKYNNYTHNQNDNILDLHGYKIHSAYLKTISYLKNMKSTGTKHVIIITGLSGTINEEFPYWLADNKKLFKRYEVLNGGGAFKIFFK